MSNPLRKKRTNPVIWTLMALMILGLGGFGARNFGGSVRSIGTVGDRDIDVQDYARALNQEISAFSSQVGQPVSFAQAQSMGIDANVRARVMATAALDNEADTIGISVGDDEVRRRIVGIQAFKGLDGKFDRDSYTLALQREGLGETEFESKLRDEAARNLLQAAVLGATVAPQGQARTLADWIFETRDFTLARLIPADLTTPVPAPSEADLTAYYDAHPKDFTRPEIRKITYVWLTPEMLSDQVKLDEAALRKSYEENIDKYVTPERRMVERLVYPTEAEATAAKARLDAGEADFAALAAERGLTLEDIDLGEVSKADLGAAGDAVFALTDPGVVGPFPSEFGPALFSMNGILDAREITFDQARDDLSAEAIMDGARRMIADRADGIEDLLAGAATLEEVADETDMRLGTIDMEPETDAGIAAYPAFRKAAEAATKDAFPTIAALDDGGIFALRLDDIVAPALRPLDEVRQAVIDGWTQSETLDRLSAMAAEIIAQVDNGAPLSSTGLVTTRFTGFARGGHIEGAPESVAKEVFNLDAGSAGAVEAPDSVFVVSLDAITPADPASADYVATVGNIKQQLAQAIAQDMFAYYTQAIETEAGITLDQGAINAVHAQMN